MAQPLGVGVGAIGIAVLADSYGVSPALWLPAALAAVAGVAVALVVLDPPRPERTVATAPNPYRDDRYLARIHGVSVLLVVPQFLVWTFALVWLVQDRGWSPAGAGALVAVAQVVGAFGRIAVGQLSDMVGSRMRVLLWVSAAAAVVMLALGVTSGLGLGLSVPGHGGRDRGHRGRQRPLLHRRGRARGTVLVRAGPRDPEHRAVPHRVGRPRRWPGSR